MKLANGIEYRSQREIKVLDIAMIRDNNCLPLEEQLRIVQMSTEDRRSWWATSDESTED